MKASRERTQARLTLTPDGEFTVMFRMERKYPEKCREFNLDAFEKTLAFWKEV